MNRPAPLRTLVLVVLFGWAAVVASACGTQPQTPSVCGPQTCTGCCDASGACQPGGAADACGGGGGQCSACSAEQVCSDGACRSEMTGEQCAPAVATPSARSDFAVGHDSVGHQLILFGGDPGVAEMCQSRPAFNGETWFYDLACGVWTQAVGNGPSARARHVGVFDAQRRRFIVFGGRFRAGSTGEYQVFNDTHALSLLDGGTWVWELMSTGGTPPPPMSSSAAVYDRSGDRMIVFGGNLSSRGDVFTPTDRVFALSLGTGQWEELVPTTATRPAARLFHAAAMDVARNRVIIFGGGGANAFFGPFFADIWAFDLASRTWTELTPQGPGPLGRIRGVLAEDPARDFVVLFGGHDDGAMGERNDLWAFDLAGNQWIALRSGDALDQPGAGFCDFPPNFTAPDLDSPERREAHYFGHVPGAGHVLFGGRTDCGVVNDVWTLDVATTTWRQTHPSFSGLSCPRSGRTNCTSLCQ